MTLPAPSGNRNGCPWVRELSNCLPLLSGAVASYSQPVYCTTAILPGAMLSPEPVLSSTDCIEVTGLGGAAAGLPPQAVIKPRSTAKLSCSNGLLSAMAAILVDFTVAVVHGAGVRRPPSNSRLLELEGGGQAEHHRRGTDQRCLGACRDGTPNGADSEAAGHDQTEFGGHPHETQP